MIASQPPCATCEDDDQSIPIETTTHGDDDSIEEIEEVLALSMGIIIDRV